MSTTEEERGKQHLEGPICIFFLLDSWWLIYKDRRLLQLCASSDNSFLINCVHLFKLSTVYIHDSTPLFCKPWDTRCQPGMSFSMLFILGNLPTNAFLLCLTGKNHFRSSGCFFLKLCPIPRWCLHNDEAVTSVPSFQKSLFQSFPPQRQALWWELEQQLVLEATSGNGGECVRTREKKRKAEN